MANTPALPPTVIQAAIANNGDAVIHGCARATTVGVQIANQIVAQPAAPTLTQTATGGTLAAGTYQVKVSITNQYGEVIGSSAASITTSGSSSTISVAAPTVPEGANANYWNVYCTQVGQSTFTLQNPTPLLLGPGGATTYLISAPPTSTGANPPAAPGFVGTLSFYSSIDGYNYNALTLSSATSATAPGVFTGTFSGLVFAKIQATSWTSGMAVVTVNVTEG